MGAIALGLIACDDPAPVQFTPPTETCAVGELDRPQAIAWVDDRVLVASSGYGDPWRAGRLTLLDADGTPRASRATRWRNPQTVHVDAERIYVVSTGAFDLSQAEPRMIDAGGVEVFDHALQPIWSVELPARAGGPVGFAQQGDQAVIGAGIRAVAYQLDTQNARWLRGAGDPIELGPDLGLGAPVTFGERTLVVDYNSDRLHVIEGDTPWACGYPLGLPEQPVLAGAKAPVVHADGLYYLLDAAGLLRRVDLSALPARDPGADCAPLPVETLWTTGLLPNDLVRQGDRWFVVHSGENSVVQLDADFAPVARYALPPNSNPWAVAVRPDGSRLAVTEWLSDAVAFIDLASGAVDRVRCGDEVAPLPPASAARDPLTRLADTVRSAPSASDAPFKDPAAATNGVQGGGDGVGGLDVYSIDLTDGDALVLCWSQGRAQDDPGADLVVFENPFESGEMTFMDLAIIGVSPDGDAWVEFPHDYRAADETVYSPQPEDWPGFAGRHPVRYQSADGGDPFDAAYAGGDRFDFADLPGAVGAQVRAEGAACVRVRPAASAINPDTGAPFVKDPVSNGPDIDGIYGRRVE